MSTRREFMSGVSAALVLPAVKSAGEDPSVSRIADTLEEPKAGGQRYEAEVPDTLDLAERCRLGIHGVAGTTDPHCYYQQWFTMVYGSRQPYLAHNGADPVCTAKYAESFPYLRTACGSQEYQEMEKMQMANLISNISKEDGLFYCVWKPDRPWHSNYMPDFYKNSRPEDVAQIGGVGRMMRSMLAWRERDGGAAWDNRLRAMTRGMAKIAIYRDDYAYYPDGGHTLQFAYPRSGWIRTTEPASDTESGEGSVLDSVGHVIYGVSRWYKVSGDPEALTLARKLATFAMLPKMWGGLAEEIAVDGSEQGHFHSHPHGHMGGLRGLLEYGMAVQDPNTLEFVRRSYEHIRTYMIPRIGWFPSNGVGDGSWAQAEGCNLADLVALPTRLSDLRLGDYWEDIDAVVRNMQMEQQLSDVATLRRIAEASPPRCTRSQWPGQETTENMPDRIVGVFASGSSPNTLRANSVMGCCAANGTQGLYYAWEAALRCDGDTAQVNLLLNRASTLADVDSYLPYEGKVIIHNKRATRVSIRILSWIDRRQLQVSVDGQLRPLNWVGNYIVVDDLKPGQRCLLQFPIPESRRTYTALHRVWRREAQFEYVFRGSTVIGVSPRDTSPVNVQIFERSQMSQTTAPMKRTIRYVPDKVLVDW